MTSTAKPSGDSWTRASKAYANIIDETDPLNPAGAACLQILDVVSTTLPFDQAQYVLDMGTGSGALISAILNSPAHAAQIPTTARLVAADISQGMLDILTSTRDAHTTTSPTSPTTPNLWPRLEIHNWDAGALAPHIPSNSISHLLASYAYFAMSSEPDALAEAHRVLAPGGLFVETSMGFTEWGHIPTFFRGVRPDTKIPGPAAHWGSVEGVTRTLEGAGFADVGAREFAMEIPCATAESAVEMVFQIFPWVKGLVAEWREGEVAEARGKMVEWVRSRHPGEEPVVLKGTGLVGWGRK